MDATRSCRRASMVSRTSRGRASMAFTAGWSGSRPGPRIGGRSRGAPPGGPPAPRAPAVAIGDADRGLVIVEAAQPGFAVALDQRCVARAPVRPRGHVAEQVK